MGKKGPFEVMTLEGYQYNLKGQLVPVEEGHKQGNLLKTLVKFNLYSTADGAYVGQIAWMPWQDGGVVSYSGRLSPPHLMLEPYFRATNTRSTVIPGMKDANLWLSSVIPLDKEKFIQVSRQFGGKVVAKYYEGDEDDNEFPATLKQYKTLQAKKQAAKRKT